MSDLNFMRVAAVAILLAVGCATTSTSDPEDEIDDSFLGDGKADSGGVVEGTPEACGVLKVVNVASLATLHDAVHLSTHAATNIVGYRLGNDQIAGTSDDQRIDTLAELDAIPYVGPIAFAKLLTYAQANGDIVSCTAGQGVPLGGVQRVFAGTDHTCALLADGNVKCWGDDTREQLGIPDPARQQTSPPLPPDNLATYYWRCTSGNCDSPTKITSMSIGGPVTHAINDDGEVLYTGAPGYDIPTALTDLTADGGVRYLSTGLGSHACATMYDSPMDWHCWGDNSANQLGGKPWTLADPYEPGVVENMSGGSGLGQFQHLYDEFSVGGFYTCAHRTWLAGHGVECWGANDHGQLGRGATGSSSAQHQRIAILDGTTHSLSAGWAHTCAIRDPNGEVLCWGANEEGQLGDGSTSDRSAPTAITGLNGVSKVAAGGSHTCVLVGTEVKCWGLNDRGQVGNGGGGAMGPHPLIGDAADPQTPVVFVAQPITVALAGPAVDVSTGLRHSCAVLADGRVQCWGYNHYGQLGNASFSDQATPVYVLQR